MPEHSEMAPSPHDDVTPHTLTRRQFLSGFLRAGEYSLFSAVFRLFDKLPTGDNSSGEEPEQTVRYAQAGPLEQPTAPIKEAQRSPRTLGDILDTLIETSIASATHALAIAGDLHHGGLEGLGPLEAGSVPYDLLVVPKRGYPELVGLTVVDELIHRWPHLLAEWLSVAFRFPAADRERVTMRNLLIGPGRTDPANFWEHIAATGAATGMGVLLHQRGTMPINKAVSIALVGPFLSSVLYRRGFLHALGAHILTNLAMSPLLRRVAREQLRKKGLSGLNESNDTK